jgi:squalene-hopene/tetraprenyl-beta-curcumene cyclase
VGSQRGQIAGAVAAAGAFLEARRKPDGFWRDFETLAGPSDEWVTAYVSYALSRGGPMPPSAFEALQHLLRRQRKAGGWAYARVVPPDCDSTAWALLALAGTPMLRPSAVFRGVRYLWSHQDGESGGFRTYSPRDGIERFIEESDPRATEGWRAPHPCVTGVALQCLAVHREPRGAAAVAAAVRYLLGRRTAEGLWPSYWWRGHAYATFHALRGLAFAGALGRPELLATCSRILAEQASGGGFGEGGGPSEPFATSLHLLSLLLAPEGERLAGALRAAAWLVERQRPDGGWDGAPILQIPPPMVVQPVQVERWDLEGRAGGALLADRGGAFTAATALWALSAARAAAA